MTISSNISNSSEKDTFLRTTALELLIENIKNSGEMELPVLSTFSMEPLILSGSKVIVRYGQLEDINLGDIVVFKQKNNLIAHRCIDVANDFLLTKGDNLSELDPPISNSGIIIGKIISVKHKTRYWNLDSSEWQSKNRQIARISFFQNKISTICLQIGSKKMQFLQSIGWALSRSFFYFYK